ncbi:hypothetical protein CL634_04005 [bacterium]|nr:hypothetical protein [bacterium]
MELLTKATAALKSLTELGLSLLAFGVVAQILFGATVPFLKVDVVGSVVSVCNQLGSEGLVGLVAVGLLASLYNRNTS